jgi:hypothetical protein
VQVAADALWRAPPHNNQLPAPFAALTTTITARCASRDGNFERYLNLSLPMSSED